LNNPGPERIFMAKKKKDGVSEQKKADMKKKWEAEDEEIINIPREENVSKKCSVPGCRNESMRTSNVCVEHYQSVSNEMSKSVEKNESEPWKMYSPTKPKGIE
jgi:hypothetical protein